ncbi:TPA: nitroreductase, partial [Escherichia coli]|nr:nitroreductase [Escherichia coli]
YIYDPKVRKTLGIKKDEVLAGFLYLTDLEGDMPKAPRKNRNLITLY